MCRCRADIQNLKDFSFFDQLIGLRAMDHFYCYFTIIEVIQLETLSSENRNATSELISTLCLAGPLVKKWLED